MNLPKKLFGIDTDIEETYKPEEFSNKPVGFSYKPMQISPQVLQRLITIRSFPNKELQAFAWSRNAEVFCPGSILFKRDQMARYLY